MTYDVSISYNKNGQGSITLPVNLSAALKSREYNRAIITITDDGLLVKPFKSERGDRNSRTVPTLPEWSA